VDVILDSIGGDVTATGLDLLAPLGQMVVYGAASGELPVLPSRSIFGLKSVIGFGIMAFQNARPDTARSEMTGWPSTSRPGGYEPLCRLPWRSPRPRKPMRCWRIGTGSAGCCSSPDEGPRTVMVPRG